MSVKRCCECEAEACGDCFAPDANSPCCRLGSRDFLMLKIPRPGFLDPIAIPGVHPCQSCPPSPGIQKGRTQYAPAPDILVRYDPYDGPNITNGGAWFSDNGSFGCFDGSDIYVLWNLWPPLCPQPEIRSNGDTYPACCGNDCTCSAPPNGPVLYSGPFGTFDGQTPGVCSLADLAGLTPINSNLTKFQKDVIEANALNRTVSSYVNCNTCSTGSVSAEFSCDYEGYEWLDGIYDDFANANGSLYRHFYWDPVAGGVQQSGPKRLAETLVTVFHKEKWYRQCETEYEYPPTEDCEVVPNWDCRVPEYWIYVCGGIPIFSWEIREMLDAGIISNAEFEWFFQAVFENKPLASGVVGKTLIDKLETQHWNPNAPAGSAILQTKDWRGTVLQNGSTVPSSETRVIRKDLVRYPGGSRAVVADQFFNARPGGWAHVCRGVSRGCTGDLGAFCQAGTLSGPEVEQQLPQVLRNHGCKTSENSPCSFPIRPSQNGITLSYDTGDKCFTAAPIPSCGICYNDAGNCVDVCSDWPDSCSIPAATVCGTQFPGLCSQDVFSAECGGVHFKYLGFYHDQTGSPAAGGIQEKCVVENSAFLWVVKQGCNADETQPFACSVGCPTNPVSTLAPAEWGIMPSLQATKDWLCNCNDSFCSKVRGVAFSGSSPVAATGFCFTEERTADDPTRPAPGTPQKGPYDQDGCGRYLCNDGKSFTLGACCIGDECIDALTEPECTQCGGTWQGKDSCCNGTQC